MIRYLLVFVFSCSLLFSNEFVLLGGGASIVIEHDGKSVNGTDIEIESYIVHLLQEKKIVHSYEVTNPKSPKELLPVSVLFSGMKSGKYTVLSRANAKGWENNPSDLSTPFLVDYNADKPTKPTITIILNKD